MTSWFEGPLAAFDTETTGVDTETDRIVSAALVVQDAPGLRPRATRWLVSPGVPVPRAATAVHGLTQEYVERHGRWPAPVMYEMAEALAEQARAGRPLVVMNAPFDLTLLDRELRRHRASSLGRWLERTSLHVLDPRVLDRHLDRYRKGGRTLSDLCAHYGVELTAAHDAAADAQAALPRRTAHVASRVVRGSDTRDAGVVRAQRRRGGGGPGLAAAPGTAGGGVTVRA
jgi:DNA polymerase-3 subunit epsilon